MRETHLCPHCRTPSVVHVPDPTDRDGAPLALHNDKGAFRVERKCLLEAYVCATCGYTELYACGLSELLSIPGAKLLPPKPESAPPYR